MGSRLSAPTSRCQNPGGSATRPITVIRPQPGPSSIRPSTPWTVCTRSTSAALAARPRYALEDSDILVLYCIIETLAERDVFMQMSFWRTSRKLRVTHIHFSAPSIRLTDCWDLPKHRSGYFGGDVWGGLETRLHETPCRGGLRRDLPHNPQRNKGAVAPVECSLPDQHRPSGRWILCWWISAHTDLRYLLSHWCFYSTATHIPRKMLDQAKVLEHHFQSAHLTLGHYRYFDWLAGDPPIINWWELLSSGRLRGN